MLSTRRKVVLGCLGGGAVFFLLALFSNRAIGQESLVRPEPAHLLALALGGGGAPGYSGVFAPFGVFTAGQDDGLGVWQFTPPPGMKSPFLMGTLLGLGAGDGERSLTAFFGAISLLDLGHQYGLYQIVDPSKVLPLADFLLDQVRDREAIGESDYGAYLQAVVQAGKVSFDAFWRAGNAGLTRGDLMNRANRLRGVVVRGQGVVRRIRRLEPLDDAVKLGVPDLYEAWVFQDLYGANPVCVVVSRLSNGLQPAEDIRRPVRFAGYFLKAYRYQATQTVQGKPVERECPLLVGPELMGLPEPVRPSADMGAWPKTLLATLLGVFALAISLVWAMTWWMGRGDRRVRARLENLTKANQLAEKGFSSGDSKAAPEQMVAWKDISPSSHKDGPDSSGNPLRVE